MLTDMFSVAGCSSWEDICVTTRDTAWVRRGCEISEVDRTGRPTRTVNVSQTWTGSCTGITSTDDGWLVTCGESEIYRVSRDGHVSTWATTTFYPCGITSVSTDQVLACGGDEGLFTVTRQGEQRVNLNVECEWIYDVATNKDGDVAVSDSSGGQVIFMDLNYQHIAQYNGEPHLTETFRPCGVTSDGDIFIVCDSNNHKLHFLDRDGVCLYAYQTTGDCLGKTPFRVDMMPGSRLWVGFEGGSFCVYDLLFISLTGSRQILNELVFNNINFLIYQEK